MAVSPIRRPAGFGDGARNSGGAGKASRGAREPAPFLDAVEQRLARGAGGEDQRHAVRKRVLDMLGRVPPLHLGERGVNDDHLLAGDNPR